MLWIEYQPISLEFRNGRPRNDRSLGFRAALLTHDEAAREARIVRLETPTAEARRLVEYFAPFELSAIRYKIWVYPKAGAAETVAPPIPYCHDFPKGSGVFLEPPRIGRGLVLKQKDGKQFFSDAFTLGDVSDGTIESTQSVFQFLETP